MSKALQKGEEVALEKGRGNRLSKVCVGMNWGAIPKKNYVGVGKRTKAVDLDGSVALFGKDNELLELVFYNARESKDGAILHSGDDLVGDRSGDDRLDNEVILVNLDKIRPTVKNIFFMLNSYTKQNFDDIPYVKIRIYEGTPLQVEDIFAYYDLSRDSAYEDRISMLMAKLFRNEAGVWKFQTIGEPIEAGDILEAVEKIKTKFL